MNWVISVVMSATVTACSITGIGTASAQGSRKSGTPVSISRALPESNEKRSMFSGGESRITVMNSVHADCSSGPLPVVRVVAPPSNGEIRFEQVKYAVDRKNDNPRFHCNGKLVDGLGVFYKPAADFVGSDKVILEVDFKNGFVNRYSYEIEVR
jgi:hypothetical protein